MTSQTRSTPHTDATLVTTDHASARSAAAVVQVRPPGVRRDTDRVIGALAAGRHGVATRTQLLTAGVGRHEIATRARRGLLERIHQGVYRVGPVRAPHLREAAALFACGPTAALSHRSASVLHAILPYPPGGGRIEVTITSGYRARGRDVCVHRVARLESNEVTVIEGLRVTTVERTIMDLAGTVAERELEQAVARAIRAGKTDPERIMLMLARHAGRPGSPSLRALLSRQGGPSLTRSEAETRLLDLVRTARLRAPHVNVKVRGFEVDFFWRVERLVVEVDGAAYHSSEASFEDDRHRDGVLAAAGFRVMRVTWRQLAREPWALVARLAQALGAGTDR